jgi:ABC-2 type transport system ATP-binding protein
MTESAIEVRGLSRSFGARKAVDALDLEVKTGEVIALLGHNGAGKTTTVRMLGGVLAPTDGSARVLGHDPVKEGPALRARIGVSTETPSVDPRLTGRENLAFAARLFGAAPGRVDAVLDEMELGDRADERVGGYSKGMKQRIALARALLHEPELLFLDEPTSGLDPVAAHHVRELVAGLAARGRTIVLCTHNLPEAERLCDRVYVLEQGRVIAAGAPSELAGGVRVTLDVDDAHRARADEIAATFGEAIPRERIPALVRALVEADVDVYGVSQAPRSLESVYLSLHASSDGDDA